MECWLVLVNVEEHVNCVSLVMIEWTECHPIGNEQLLLTPLVLMTNTQQSTNIGSRRHPGLLCQLMFINDRKRYGNSQWHQKRHAHGRECNTGLLKQVSIWKLWLLGRQVMDTAARTMGYSRWSILTRPCQRLYGDLSDTAAAGSQWRNWTGLAAMLIIERDWMTFTDRQMIDQRSADRSIIALLN